MTTNRTYGEGCAIAHALDLVGERWALMAVRVREPRLVTANLVGG